VYWGRSDLENRFFAGYMLETSCTLRLLEYSRNKSLVAQERVAVE
jgi:hypothetical protein